MFILSFISYFQNIFFRTNNVTFNDETYFDRQRLMAIDEHIYHETHIYGINECYIIDNYVSFVDIVHNFITPITKECSYDLPYVILSSEISNNITSLVLK